MAGQGLSCAWELHGRQSSVPPSAAHGSEGFKEQHRGGTGLPQISWKQEQVLQPHPVL